MRRQPYPVYSVPWTVCSVCGLSFPATQVRLTRKHGYCCRPMNVWGTSGCDPGDFDRDDVVYIPRPYEGVRKTNAPLAASAYCTGTDVDATTYSYDCEGIDADDDLILWRDQSTGLTYSVTFGEGISWLAVAGPPYGVGGWVLDGPWRVWLANAELNWGTSAPGPYTMIARPAAVDLTVNTNQELVYVP